MFLKAESNLYREEDTVLERSRDNFCLFFPGNDTENKWDKNILGTWQKHG